MERMKKTLVIAEDEEELREMLVEQLEVLGLEILTAPNGQDALDVITQRNDIDGILSDINMPVMTGLQLLAEIRSRGLEIPFVILTGFADRQNTVEALRLSAMDFLEKPYNPAVLVQTLERAVTLGYQIRQIEQDLHQLCEQASMTRKQKEEFIRTKRAILMMRFDNNLKQKRAA